MIEDEAVKVMGKIDAQPGIANKFIIIHQVGGILVEQKSLISVMVPEKGIWKGSPDLAGLDLVLGIAYGGKS